MFSDPAEAFFEEQREDALAVEDFFLLVRLLIVDELADSGGPEESGFERGSDSLLLAEVLGRREAAEEQDEDRDKRLSLL